MSNQQREDRFPHFWLAIIILLVLTALTSHVHAQQSVTLTWTQNTESDLAGYEFHRAFIDCNTPNAATLLQPHVKVGKVGTYSETLPANTKIVCYGIKAFDTSNNFSTMSNLAGKVFPVVPTLLGHWDKKTDILHDPSHNVKTYTIHALVRPKAALVGFAPLLVKNYTYFFYASVRGYCGDGGVLVGHTSTGRLCSPTPVEPLTWTALTATFDGTTLALYRNKILVTTQPTPVPLDSTDTLQIAGSKFNETCNCDLEVWLYEGAMSASEVAALPQAPTPPVISPLPTVLAFSSQLGQPDPSTQAMTITNVGAGTLTWSATANQPWITLTPASGTSSQGMLVGVTAGSLPAGTHLAQITITATDAQPVTVSVTYTITPDTTPPKAPTNFILSSRPTADSAVIAWQQPGGVPAEYRVEFFRSTAWIEDHRLTGTKQETRVVLPEIGRRIYRVCALNSGAALCPPEGVWASR